MKEKETKQELEQKPAVEVTNTGAALENPDETAMEMAKRLTKEVEEYKKEIDEIKTQEELDEKEKEIISIMEKNDEHLRNVNYILPKGVDFEGKHYTKNAVAIKIIAFISKIEQSWQYVKGLYDLCTIWSHDDYDKITYGALDSTLRLLDQVKYSGMREWRDILIINEFMKPLHEAYAKETTYQIYLGHKHSAIISRRDLIDPVKKAAKDAASQEPSGAPELNV